MADRRAVKTTQATDFITSTPMPLCDFVCLSTFVKKHFGCTRIGRSFDNFLREAVSLLADYKGWDSFEMGLLLTHLECKSLSLTCQGLSLVQLMGYY
jgi:hypothetical protein